MTSEFSIAIHGLVYLYHQGGIISSEELADNICTNAARVRKIMGKLKHKDLILSKEGKGSGYCIIPNGNKITLLDVLIALDTKVVSAGWQSGDIDKNCLISSGMGSIMEGIYKELDITCRKQLSHISIGDIDKQIFKKQ